MSSTSPSSHPISTLPSLFGSSPAGTTTLYQLLIRWHFTFIKSIPHNHPKSGIFMPSPPPPLFFLQIWIEGIIELNHSSTPNKERDQILNPCLTLHAIFFPLRSTLKHLKGRVLTHLSIFLHQNLGSTHYIFAN